jgi:hypothetical protein
MNLDKWEDVVPTLIEEFNQYVSESEYMTNTLIIELYVNGDEYGGYLELTENKEGGYIQIWSGLGFNDYTFKIPVKTPTDAYNTMKFLINKTIEGVQ